MSYINELYNTPLETHSKRPWFIGARDSDLYHGTTRFGRSFITTKNGIIYGAYYPTSNVLKIVQSDDNGYSWQTLKILYNVYKPDKKGPIYTFYSEMREQLIVAFLHTYTTPAKDHVRFYNVTTDTYIDYNFNGTEECNDGLFVMSGNIDTGVILVTASYYVILDINHTSGPRITGPTTIPSGGGSFYDNNYDVYYLRRDIYDLPIYDQFNVYYFKTGGSGKELTLTEIRYDNISGFKALVHTTIKNNFHEPQEILAVHRNCVVCDWDTNSEPQVWIYGTGSSGTAITQITADAGSAWHQNYQDGYPDHNFLAIPYEGLYKFLLLYNKNDQKTAEPWVTEVTIAANGTATKTADKRIQDQVGYMSVFTTPLPANQALITEASRPYVKILYNISGHLYDEDGQSEAPIQQVHLGDKAYPTTYTSSYITQSISDYWTAGHVGILSYEAKYMFDKIGFNALILKYEVSTDKPCVSQIYSYTAPTEKQTKVMMDELTLKNPTGIQLEENAGDYGNVREKDVRKVFLAPNEYLPRTYKRTMFGDIRRTVYLLLFYGRYYEITQITPIFKSQEIIAYTANAYVCGPSYDPFSRAVLPNET